MFATEIIPDEDSIYCRVHKDLLKNSRPSARAFMNTPKEGNNLSCDWSKYCTPEGSRALIGRQKNLKTGEFKRPLDFYIYNFRVQDLRYNDIMNQAVLHDPIFNEPEIEGKPNNQAHSIIVRSPKDEDYAEIRLKMVDMGSWALGPE